MALCFSMRCCGERIIFRASVKSNNSTRESVKCRRVLSMPLSFIESYRENFRCQACDFAIFLLGFSIENRTNRIKPDPSR